MRGPCPVSPLPPGLSRSCCLRTPSLTGCDRAVVDTIGPWPAWTGPLLATARCLRRSPQKKYQRLHSPLMMPSHSPHPTTAGQGSFGAMMRWPVPPVHLQQRLWLSL